MRIAVNVFINNSLNVHVEDLTADNIEEFLDIVDKLVDGLYPAEADPNQKPEPELEVVHAEEVKPVEPAKPAESPECDQPTLSDLIVLVRSAPNSKVGEIAGILSKFGVSRVAELKPEQIPAAYKAIEEILL